MHTNIIEWIDLVNRYVQEQAFRSDKSITKFLYTMKYNPTLEWFNCARIASCIKENEDELLVHSLTGWEKILDMELESELNAIEPYKIALLSPFFSYQNGFEWEPVDVYPKYIIDSITPVMIYRTTPIQNILHANGFDEIRPYLHEAWANKSFEKYLSYFHFYYEASDALKQFYRSILFLSFGKDLKIKEEYQGINLHCIDNMDRIVIFKNIHEIITTFHVYMKRFLKVFDSSKERLKELGYLKENVVYNGLEQLEKLERNERLFERE